MARIASSSIIRRGEKKGRGKDSKHKRREKKRLRRIGRTSSGANQKKLFSRKRGNLVSSAQRPQRVIIKTPDRISRGWEYKGVDSEF